MLCRLTTGKLEEPKTPSPRHTNPRKKQKRDMFAPRNEDGSDFRYSNGTKCLRWKNRKPFRRVTKRRLELQSLSPFLCIKR
jgi:histone demethylase JARID1